MILCVKSFCGVKKTMTNSKKDYFGAAFESCQAIENYKQKAKQIIQEKYPSILKPWVF